MTSRAQWFCRPSSSRIGSHRSCPALGCSRIYASNVIEAPQVACEACGTLVRAVHLTTHEVSLVLLPSPFVLSLSTSALSASSAPALPPLLCHSPPAAAMGWCARAGMHRVVAPFLACGDLRGFDSDRTYPLHLTAALDQPTNTVAVAAPAVATLPTTPTLAASTMTMSTSSPLPRRHGQQQR